LARKTSGFERIKEQKKQSILRAALELVKKYGIKKVNIYDIAREAGVSQVTIYSHFGSRENVIREAIKVFIHGYMGEFDQLVKSDKPYLEKLEKIVFEKNQFVSQFGPDLVKAIYRDDPELTAYIDSYMKEVVMPVTLELVHQGKQQGYINEKLSDESIIAYLQIVRSGMYANQEVIELLDKKPKIIRDLITLFTYGFNG